MPADPHPGRARLEQPCSRTHGVGCLTSILLLMVASLVSAKYPGAAVLLVILAFCG